MAGFPARVLLRSAEELKGLPKVLVLTGPTGTGKSDLAVSVARLLMPMGQVISADSVAVHSHTNIGSWKPSSAQQRGVTHHLLDTVSPNLPYSAIDWCREAHRTTRTIHEKAATPIVVGGSAAYIRWYESFLSFFFLFFFFSFLFFFFILSLFFF